MSQVFTLSIVYRLALGKISAQPHTLVSTFLPVFQDTANTIDCWAVVQSSSLIGPYSSFHALSSFSKNHTKLGWSQPGLFVIIMFSVILFCLQIRDGTAIYVFSFTIYSHSLFVEESK